MKKAVIILSLAIASLCLSTVCNAQQPQEPNIEDVINSQLDRLTTIYKLDDIQIFFVDSILHHNFPAMMEEFEATKKTGASNQETFQAISDRWMDATDKALERFFTEEQWAKYMKSSAGKEKKKRDKRLSGEPQK